MLDALISAAAGLAGAGINKRATEETNAQNAQIARETNEANAGIADKTNAMNMKIAQANIDYQNQFNAQTWEREDNAHQREVADLINAGLSPLLATGGATSGGGSAPQNTATMEGYNAEGYNVAQSDAGNLIANGLQNMATSMYNNAMMKEKAEQFKIDTDIKNLELAQKTEQFERSMDETERHNAESERIQRENENWKNKLANTLLEKTGKFVSENDRSTVEEKIDKELKKSQAGQYALNAKEAYQGIKEHDFKKTAKAIGKNTIFGKMYTDGKKLWNWFNKKD